MLAQVVLAPGQTLVQLCQWVQAAHGIAVGPTQGLLAPLVLDGPINGNAFVAWAEQFFVPELRAGDTVVMGNLGSHKVAGVKQAIEGAGAVLRYLPPHSPDLNPIEQGFS